MTVEDNKITNVERVRAKILAEDKKRPEAERLLLDKTGGVPLHQKDEDELESLMRQVAEQTNFAQKELGEWSLVGRTHGADTPKKLEELLVKLKLEKHELKVKFDEHVDKHFAEITQLRNRRTNVKINLTNEQTAALNMLVKYGPNTEQLLNMTDSEGRVVASAAMLEELSKVLAKVWAERFAPGPVDSPTTLPEGTPGGEAKAAEPRGFLPAVKAWIAHDGELGLLTHFTNMSALDGVEIEIDAPWKALVPNKRGVVRGQHGGNPELYVVETPSGWYWCKTTDFVQTYDEKNERHTKSSVVEQNEAAVKASTPTDLTSFGRDALLEIIAKQQQQIDAMESEHGVPFRDPEANPRGLRVGFNHG